MVVEWTLLSFEKQLWNFQKLFQSAEINKYSNFESVFILIATCKDSQTIIEWSLKKSIVTRNVLSIFWLDFDIKIVSTFKLVLIE